MSVIIRLQGLPWSASAMDIRNFFRGLFIQQGGVHIIGGEKGDAFIAFSSDEDARQAMMRSNACLNGVPVQLLLSSRSEMQNIIDEAHNRSLHGMGAVAPTSARGMPPANSGGPQGVQNQSYTAPTDMNNQRHLQQPGGNYQKPPDSSQGQFSAMQNTDRGYSPMQTQMHAQQMPDRANQYGFHNERRPDPYQQNVPTAGKQKPGREGQDTWAQHGYEGFQSETTFGKDNQQQNQWNMGGYGSRMDGGYEQQDGSQRQQESQQPYGSNQPPRNQPPRSGNQPPQSYGPGQQRDLLQDHYNPASQGQEARFPQQQGGQQKRPYDQFWQEDYSAGNRDSVPKNSEQPQDTNRRGNLQRPGQTNQPAGMLETGQMGAYQGSEDHMRFSAMNRPNMEQMPSVQQGQGRGRGPPGEPQNLEEHWFPPRRDGPVARGGPGEGMFADAKRGILPTPDMDSQGQQGQFSGEQFYNPEGVEQGQWPEEGMKDALGYQQGRGPGPVSDVRGPDRSMGRGRPFDAPETHAFGYQQGRGPGPVSDVRGPDKSMGRGRPFDAPESHALGYQQGRGTGPVSDVRGPDNTMGRGRPFDAPESHRPRDRPRRSRFDQVDERSTERGPDGRPNERGYEQQTERNSDQREQDRGFDGRPFRRGPDVPQQDEWLGPDRRNQNRFGGELEGRAFDRDLGNRPGDRDVGGMGFDRGDRDVERPIKKGQDSRPKEGGLLGSRPPPGFEGQGEDSYKGRQFEESHGNFPPNEGQDPMEIEDNQEDQEGPARRGPPGRRFPGARDFDDQDRRERFGRSHDRRFEGPRGGRGNDHGRGRGRRPFDREDRFGQRFEDGRSEGTAGEERRRDRFDREEGGSRYSDRPMRGRGRPEDSRSIDRRPVGHGREDNMRSRNKDSQPVEPHRSASKGLLGDAPGCLLPTPSSTADEPQLMQHIPDDSQRDRDKRHREDRDTGREERSGRRSDRRDRSPSREHRHSERDRSELRDRFSGRDTRESTRRGAEKSGKNEKKLDEPETKFIHAKGFPSSYTTMEIQRFFFGCDLLFTGINIVKNAHRQSTGEVYLEFPTVDNAKMAILKNGETIFGTAVTMAFITKQQFDEKTKSPSLNTDKEKPSVAPAVQEDRSGHIVKINGLPPNIKREDLVNFFSSVKLVNSGKSVVIEYDDKRQATGMAFIVAASKKDFESAMTYNGHILGSKALQLSAGEQTDMDACVAKQDKMSTTVDPPNTHQEKSPTGLGLPAGLGVMGARPPLMGMAPPRRPPHFAQGTDAPRNGPAFESPPHPFPRPPPPGIKSPKSFGPGFCVQIQGLPMLVTYNDIREFFSGLNIAPHRGVQIVHDGNGKPTGEGFVEFVSQEDKDKAMKKDKTSLGTQIVAVKSVAKPDMIERLRKARMSGTGPNPSGSPPFPPVRGGDAPPFMPIPSHLLNPHLFYVSCQNFPTGISVSEIVEFFQEYNPAPDSIRQLYADDGTSTGNAVVGFFSRADAEMALHELNGTLCGQSMVILQPIKG